MLVSARVAVVIASGSTMSIDSACASVVGLLAESVTDTVKFELPAGPAGVPVMAPAELIESPAGKAPALMLNVFAPLPPVEAMASLYAEPTTPSLAVVVVMLSGPPPPPPPPPPPQAVKAAKAIETAVVRSNDGIRALTGPRIDRSAAGCRRALRRGRTMSCLPSRRSARSARARCLACRSGPRRQRSIPE